MTKRVLIIGSGETERRVLPVLLRRLRDEGIYAEDVRIPSGGGSLTLKTVVRIARAAWFETNAVGQAPDKLVVLVDANGKSTDDAIAELESPLTGRLGELPLTVRVAAAKRHLEAWFFGDEEGLRAYLGRNLGNVDASAPDDIRDPKHHLRNLLAGELYTARIAEEIARRVAPEAIYGRSASFANFVDTVRNGANL